MGTVDIKKLVKDRQSVANSVKENVLPDIVNAYSKPVAEVMGKIDSITMYGECITAKLTEEIFKNGTQIFE